MLCALPAPCKTNARRMQDACKTSCVGHSAPRHSAPAPVAERAFNATGRSAMATIQPHCLETLYRFPLLTQRRLVARNARSARFKYPVDAKWCAFTRLSRRAARRGAFFARGRSLLTQHRA